MKLTVTTPDQIVCENREIDGIFVKTDDGPLGILNHHASLLTSTNLGYLRVIDGSETDTYTLREATIKVDNPTNSITILALGCSLTAEIDQLDLENYLNYIHEALTQHGLDKESLRYKFLANEKITLERQRSGKK